MYQFNSICEQVQNSEGFFLANICSASTRTRYCLKYRIVKKDRFNSSKALIFCNATVSQWHQYSIYLQNPNIYEIVTTLPTKELRFCDRCMIKTHHEILEDPEIIYTYKRKRLYRCKECGHKSFRSGLRPSAESVY
jgi:hypothetical protein